ncbi:MAG: hypothetical protein P4L31_02865 [Candidatus Babeliales bacterium]|nr:hypothetical protein [Candidatus Babeliales bacterium]
MNYSKVLSLLVLYTPLTIICCQSGSQMDPLQQCYIARKDNQCASIKRMKMIEEDNKSLQLQIGILKLQAAHHEQILTQLKEEKEQHVQLAAHAHVAYDDEQDDWVKEGM